MTYFTYETGLNRPVDKSILENRVAPNRLVVGVCLETSTQIHEVLELFVSDSNPLTQGKIPVFPNVELHPMTAQEAARHSQEGGYVLVENTMKENFLQAKKEVKPSSIESFSTFAQYARTLLGFFQPPVAFRAVNGKDVVYFEGNIIDAVVEHYHHVLDMRI